MPETTALIPMSKHLGRTPWVDHRGELERLLSLAQVLRQERHAGVIVVYGDEGVGKSRLVYAFQQGLAEQKLDCTWLAARGEPGLTESLSPMLSLLNHYFQQSPRTDNEQNHAAFHRIFNDLLQTTPTPALREELERTRSILAALVGLRWENSLYEQLDPRLRFENCQHALKALLLAESRRRPLLLLIEDAHYLDEDTLNFLTVLTRNTTGYPMAVLLTSCFLEDGGRLALVTDADVALTELTLAGLSHHESFELAAFLLARTLQQPVTLCPEIQKHILLAYGNPFHIEQLILDLLERQAIQQQGECWNYLPQACEGSSPALQALLLARLRRLPAETQRALQAAAVLGQEFELDTLQIMLGEEQDLLPALEIAFKLGFCESDSPNQGYFTHSQYRQTLLSTMPASERANLSLLALKATENLCQNCRPGTARRLAEYADQGGESGRAINWYRQSAEEAAQRYANNQAIYYISRALELLDSADPAPAPGDDAHDKPPTRYELLMLRQSIYALLGARSAQRQDLAALIDLTNTPNTPAILRARVYLRQVLFYEANGDYSTAIAAVHQAINLTRPLQEEEHEAAVLLANGFLYLGRIFWRLGEFLDARYPLEYSLAMARELRLPALEAECLRSLGSVSRYLGNYPEAREYFEQALLISTQINDLLNQSASLNNLGTLLLDQGEQPAARGIMQQALAIKRQIGDRRGEALSLMNLGAIAAELMEYETARQHLEMALAIGEEINDRYNLAMTLNNLGDVSRCLGKYMLARSYLDRSLTLRSQIGDRRGEATTTMNLGFIFLKLGDYTTARDLMDQALKVFREINFAQGQSWAFSYLGLLCHQINDDEAALVYSRMALRITTEIGDRSTHGDALTYQAHSLVRLGQLNDAAGLYNFALTLRKELHQPNLALDVLAGMARLCLARNDSHQAMGHVEQILEHLKTGTLDGTIEPVRAYLTCYTVLSAHNDLRAAEILETARTWLEERSALISDLHLRLYFMENIVAHRMLLQTWIENHPPT